MAGNLIKLCVLSAVLRMSNSTNFTDELHALTEAIAERYFRAFRCVTYIADGEVVSLPKWDRQVLVINAESGNFRELLRNGYEQGCSGFVIRASSQNRSSVIAGMIQVYKKSLLARYNDKRYLFLPRDEEDNDTSFLDTHDMYYMPNLVFVAPGNQTEYQVFGHNYFHGYKYDLLRIKYELLDTWYPGKGFERNKDLFPNKIINLHGKVVRFSMLQYSPYTLVIQDGDDVIYDGLETRIAAQFVESSNGTWIGLDNPVDLWGDIFSNGTGTGVFGTVLDNTVDMGFSAIYQWYCDILECSYPYIYAGVTCLAPKPDMVSGWLTIVLPFEPNAWIAFTVTFTLVSLFIFAVTYAWNRMRSNGASQSCIALIVDSFFNTFRLQLEQIPTIAYMKTPMAYFFKMWTVYCFFVAVCWQGGIASFLTVPRYEEPVNDVMDLVSRFPKLHWGANHNAWTKSIAQASDPVMVKVVQEFVVEDDATLKARVPKKEFAYFVERLPAGHFGYNDYIDREGMQFLRLMEENIYFAFCVIILTRGSPYQERLDQILHWMIDTGIIMKMEVQVALERTDNKLQTIIRTSSEKPKDVATKLQVSHILGALMIYLFGVSVSAVAFLLEMQALKHRGGPPTKNIPILRRFL